MMLKIKKRWMRFYHGHFTGLLQGKIKTNNISAFFKVGLFYACFESLPNFL